jgi:hypothetical protein
MSGARMSGARMSGGPWRGTGPELAIAGAAWAATAAAGYAVAGAGGLATVSIVAAALAVAAARALLPRREPEAARTVADKPAEKLISGYSRRRWVVAHARETPQFYEHELRPALEHVLASRLAEHHGVNLYHEPGRAHEIVNDPAVWYWIDPEQAQARQRRATGIPPRTLVRLIHRLEQL